jgi:hypothetical protein
MNLKTAKNDHQVKSETELLLEKTSEFDEKFGHLLEDDSENEDSETDEISQESEESIPEPEIFPIEPTVSPTRYDELPSHNSKERSFEQLSNDYKFDLSSD